MKIATKEGMWEQFKVDEMGEESYSSMIFFGHNIFFMDRLLILEGVFLDELERGIREPQVRPDERLKIVQVGQMDALSKIMIMMESMFITIGVFKEDKRELASKLREYEGSDVWNVVNDILDGRFSIADYWKIMGFPKLSKLGLTPQESTLVEKMLNGVLEEYSETIMWLATFYEQHHRLYNKFKHGLSVKFGYRSLNIGGPRYSLMAFDKLRIGRRRTVIPVHRATSLSLPSVIVSKSDDSVWHKYSKAMSYTRRVVVFLAKNNMVRLQNCNEDFIPYDYDTEGNRELLHFPKTLTDDEIKGLEPILSKLEIETFYHEDKVPDYGTLDDLTGMKVARRLTNEDVVEIE